MPARRVSVQPKKESSLEVRDQIVLDHLPLVKAIAIRVHENLPVHIELDDLIHAGVPGLFDAVEKYDATKNVEFQSYAKHRIKGAILDSLRQLDWASRDMRRRQKQADTVSRDFTAKFGRTPTEAEVAEQMGVTIERWRHMAMELRNNRPGLHLAARRSGPPSGNGIRSCFGRKARQHLRTPRTARHSGSRHRPITGAVSESGVSVLHKSDDHEADRRPARC